MSDQVEPDRVNHLRSLRGAEYWQLESQRLINERYSVEPKKYNSRRSAMRAAKRLSVQKHSIVRAVRVVEARFNQPGDIVYPDRIAGWRDTSRVVPDA